MRSTYKKIISVLFLLFLIYPAAAYSATYYVSTTGSDLNPGTLIQPWRTVQKAASTVVAGDTAYVRRGTYNEYMIRFAHSGSNGSPITIKGYPGETAVIDGGFTSAAGRRPVFDIDFVDYITLEGLTIRRGDIANIFVAYNGTATGITIKDCELQDFVANDNSGYIYLDSGADKITIERNLMYGIQGSNGNAAGIIIFNVGDLYIRNNNIHSSGAGIYYKHSLNNESTTIIENNLLYDFARWGIRASKKDTIIRNNIIKNASGLAIHLFEESATCERLVSTDNQIIHNTIADVATGIVLDRSASCPGAVNTTVRDNIIYNCTGTELRCLAVYPYYSGSDTSNTTLQNNVFKSNFSAPIRVRGNFYTTSTVPLTGANNQQTLPLFRNYSKPDFTLQPGSPGWKAATDVTDVGANPSLVGTDVSPGVPADLH